jgi:hypothetical protein
VDGRGCHRAAPSAQHARLGPAAGLPAAPGLHFGDAVFTGATDSRTDTVHGLTEGQALTLLDLYQLRINAHLPGARFQ